MEELSPSLEAKTITFSSILRNGELDADLFQFHPPEGSKGVAVINWLDPLAQARNGAFRVSNDVTAPLLVNMVPPDSVGDASKGPSSSTVFLSAEVSSEGVPQNIKVLRSAGDGPDEEAIESVKKWRFEPGMKVGEPVTVVTVLGVIVPTR